MEESAADGAKRKRAAPARHGDYAEDEEADEIDAKPKRQYVPPKEKLPPKEKPAPAPKIKLTITAPTPQLTKEEQHLLDKYAALRALIAARRERGAAADAQATQAKPASVQETEAALAELARLQQEDGSLQRPRAKPSRRGSSKVAEATLDYGTSGFGRSVSGSFGGNAGNSGGGGSRGGSDGGGGDGDDDDDVGYAGVDEFD